MCFYMLGVILCVMAPVQIGHYIFPSLTPLTLRFNDVLFEVLYAPLTPHLQIPLCITLTMRAAYNSNFSSYTVSKLLTSDTTGPTSS
jgi:hypothetical protein